MIAVWDGKTLKTVDSGGDVFIAAKIALNGGFIEVMSSSYIKSSKLFTTLRSVGILVMTDEDGVAKGLPMTWLGSAFCLFGPVVFTGTDGLDFKPLTDIQLDILKKEFP